jgi:hypothetical protein
LIARSGKVQASRKRWQLAALFTTLGLLAVAGCPEPKSSQTRRAQQNQLRQKDRGEALIDSAVNQLADLPSLVDMQLRPPSVILDASKSADGQDVMAIGIANPNVPDGPINVINVPAQNSLFQRNRISSGDVIKYYIIEDETVDKQRQEEGLGRQLAKELTIAQVVNESTLLVEGSLPEEVLFPAKLEVWRYSDERLLEINQKLVLYHERQLPPLGWEPSADQAALAQIVVWLNQWLRQSEPKADWIRDPMLKTLNAALATDKNIAAAVAPAALAAQQFEPHEGRLLQEAVWLRDISRWAQGDDFNDLKRATALFDWTVRNVQLIDDAEALPRRPWQVLVHGHGSAEQRAWVFAMLARQQGLDVVIVKVKSGEQGAEGQNAEGLQSTTLTGVLLDKQIYLFDPRLGLPLPGPAGEGVATLEQLRQDDALLRQLDLDGAAYPLTAEALKNAEVSIVADPFDLSKRARQLEAKLTGEDHLVLTSAPTQLSEQLKEVPEIGAVKLWDVPFRTLGDQLALGILNRQREALAFEPFANRPGLWKARTRHFQGRKLAAKESLDEAIDDHREAVKLYTEVRPTDRQIARVSSNERRRVANSAKLGATYWLGLLSYDEGKNDVAIHWLARPELSEEDSPWAAGARYNLARAYEANSNFEEAAKILEADTSPQQHGNRLRAKRLKALAQEAEKKSDQ